MYFENCSNLKIIYLVLKLPRGSGEKKGKTDILEFSWGD